MSKGRKRWITQLKKSRKSPFICLLCNLCPPRTRWCPSPPSPPLVRVDPCCMACGPVPWPEIELCPLQWECGVLSTRPQESPGIDFLYSVLTEMLISFRSTLPNIPSNVLPAVWASLKLIKLIPKISHHTSLLFFKGFICWTSRVVCSMKFSMVWLLLPVLFVIQFHLSHHPLYLFLSFVLSCVSYKLFLPALLLWHSGPL